MLDTWTTLRYRDGYAHHLRRGAGRMELTLAADRHARAAFFTDEGATPTVVREGTLADWVLLELLSNLRAMGFPNLPKEAARAGGWMALLSVAAPAGTHQAWILPGHRKAPAVDQTVLLLEAVASALNDGSSYKPSSRLVLKDGG